MAKKGNLPNDYRSEAERIRTRPGTPDFDAEFNVGGRSPEDVRPGREERYGSGEPQRSRAIHPDTSQRKEIARLLAMEPACATSEIEVEVQKGIALLRGSVDTINTKYQVEEIARRVAGITSVNNQLKVRVGGAMDEFTRGSAAARLRDESTRSREWD